MPRNGETVRAFERAFADYVGAKYAIALCNGTATLHTALVALGIKPGDRVATTPLTMSATSIAILQAGAVPEYHDVDPRTWLMSEAGHGDVWSMPVSLYGLPVHYWHPMWVDDAAQTLRKHEGAHFTSYSFQASKILSLGEGGMLVTDSEELATKAREFSSLGYKMKADQPRISSDVLKRPEYERHHLASSWNYRMNDLTAAEGLKHVERIWNNRLVDTLLYERQQAASFYQKAIEGCSWVVPQYVPEGWSHDYWTFAIALESKELWKPFTDAIVRHGGEMPYGAWRLTYDEPAFRHLNRCRYQCPACDPSRPTTWINRTGCGTTVCQKHGNEYFASGISCPIAESIQPRLVQFQTNSLESAEKNAKAVKKAIEDVSGRHDLIPPFYTRAKPHGIPTGDYYATDKNFWGDATGTPCS